MTHAHAHIYIVLMCCSALLEAQDVQTTPEKPSWGTHAMAYAYFTPDEVSL
ncbi:MAG: hypothetical protein IPF79_05900 [Ignavibacteria bacterium]|nr:hypothetical protein [Ignavibacteria bacterium]